MTHRLGLGLRALPHQLRYEPPPRRTSALSGAWPLWIPGRLTWGRLVKKLYIRLRIYRAFDRPFWDRLVVEERPSGR